MKTLSEVCGEAVLRTKWLVAPTMGIGQQWIENAVRGGQALVNLRPTTVLQLGLEVVGGELAEKGMTLASRSLGPLIIESAWENLNRGGYLGRMKPTGQLASMLFESIHALRMVGGAADQLDVSQFESPAKAADIQKLWQDYEAFLEKQRLVDEPEILKRAIAMLQSEPQFLGKDTWVIIPNGMQFAGLEQRLIKAIPTRNRIEIQHPASAARDRGPSTDIRLLLNFGKGTTRVDTQSDDSLQLFRAVGEVNEIRELLRRCLASQYPLDDVEILHTDSATYVPLIFATAQRYCCEPEHASGIPVTFAEGIPASLTRPARALTSWLQWIDDGYSQRRLVAMIEEGLLVCGDDEELGFGALARLLRPIAIGAGAENYLRKLDEQLAAMRKNPPTSTDPLELERRNEMHDRRRRGLQSLRRLVKPLLELSSGFSQHRLCDGAKALTTAEKFLDTTARSVHELDRYAADALREQLVERRTWLERLPQTLDVGTWLADLPTQMRVLASGPRPGHLHVAPIDTGGHSGRQRTFIVGLNDHRFPGAFLQDPILLDRERKRLSGELKTSVNELRARIEEVKTMIAQLPGSVTLSWPCHNLSDDRELFPSSLVLEAHRLVCGRQDADLESLNAAVGAPVSFAPTTPEKSLDESERWLWLLTDEGVCGSNQTDLVESHFPHLARGSNAACQRFHQFGPFNGYVPQAGDDLDPYADDGPILSASMLETAGRCPLAYFFRSGLALYPRDEFEWDPDRWLDAAQFGLLVHDVFRQFMDELSRTGKKPVFERDHPRLAEILARVVQQWRDDIPVPNENAFRVQYWQLIRTCRTFLQEEEQHCQTSQPRYFEVALGMESRGDLEQLSAGPLDDREPIRVRLSGAKVIRARGQIDRVDETSAGKYAIWDYKVGSGYGYDRTDPFLEGRRVQSVLYLRMVETALQTRIHPQAEIELFGYFFPGVRAQGLRVPWPADKLAAGFGVLEQLCDSIRAGAFVATNNEEDCRYCDYATVCHNVQRVTKHSQSLCECTDIVPLQHFRELRRG